MAEQVRNRGSSRVAEENAARSANDIAQASVLPERNGFRKLLPSEAQVIWRSADSDPHPFAPNTARAPAAPLPCPGSNPTSRPFVFESENRTSVSVGSSTSTSFHLWGYAS